MHKKATKRFIVELQLETLDVVKVSHLCHNSMFQYRMMCKHLDFSCVVWERQQMLENSKYWLKIHHMGNVL